MKAKPGHILQAVPWIVFVAVCATTEADVTQQVVAGSSVWMDCKDFVGDGNLPVRWKAGETTSNLNIMTQIKSLNFTEIYDTRYKERLSRPKWGVCQLSNYRPPDSQDYYCVISPPTQTRTFRFIIIEPPSAAPSVQVSATYVREGEAAVLTCNRDPTTQGTVPQYRWKKDEGELGQAQSGNQLRLNTVRGDQGSYRCVVKNIAGESPLSQPKTLEVDYPSERTTLTGYTTGEVLYSGDSLTLACTAYGGKPRPTLTWNCLSTTGTAVNQPDRTISSFTSTITKDWHDKSCSCSSSHRSMSPQQASPVIFNVYSPPEGASVESGLPWLDKRIHRSNCSVTNSGHPDPNYTWYINNQQVGTGASISLTASKEDNGKKLKCQVKNAHTDRSGYPIDAEVTLDVQYNPVVSLDPSAATVTRKENETLTLSCSADSNPAASVSDYQWTMDSVHHTGGQQLHIQEVKKTDAGVYRCTVTVQGAQDYGSLRGYAETNVQIQYRPGTPVIDPDRSFPTPVSVEIWWRANFDGGYPQTFSVHYAEEGMEYILYQSGLADQGYNRYHYIRVTSLKPEITYKFKVVAHNGHEGGSSTASNEVIITTLGRPMADNTTTNVVRHGNTSYLTWQKPHGAYDAQRIYRHDTTDKRKKQNTDTCTSPTCVSSDALSVDTTSYNATGLVEGRKYQFELVLFYRGDVVQRQRFVEPVTRVSRSSRSLVEAVVGGVVGVCIAVITVIIIIKVVLKRRHTKIDRHQNDQRKPVYQNVNPSKEDETYQDLQMSDEYEVVHNNIIAQEQAYEDVSESGNINLQRETETNYQELDRKKDSTEYENISRDGPSKTYEKLRYDTGCSLSTTN